MRARFGDDTSIFLVDWQWAPDDAKPLPFPTAFGSDHNDPEHIDQDQVGEVRQVFYPLAKTFIAPWLDGSHYCGDQQFWQQGWPAGTPPISLLDGVPLCCPGTRPPRPGGLAFGGTSVVETPNLPMNKGGLAFGGRNVERLLITSAGGLGLGGESQTNPVPYVTKGGVYVGGSSTFTRNNYEVEGGLALGGESVASIIPPAFLGGLPIGGTSLDREGEFGKGGLSLGGKSTLKQKAGPLSGGLLLGGTTAPKQRRTASGGLQIGGTAAPVMKAPAAKGGLELGGTSINPPSNVYIWDKMTGSAASMSGRHPDTVAVGGATWTNGSPGHNITGSNSAINASTALVQYTDIDGTLADFTLTCDVIIATAHPVAEVVFRATDGSNLWVAALVDTSVDSHGFILSKRVSGSDTVVGSYGLGQPANGHTYTVKIVASGSSINVYLDGTLRITASDSYHSTSTRVGLRSVWNGSSLLGGSYTNFKLTK